MRRYARPRTWFLGCLLVTAIGAAACDEKLSDFIGPSTPDLAPTFASIRSEIFETTETAGRPACITCHTNVGGRFPPQGLNLRSDPYTALVGVAARGRAGATLVIPGNPEDSYLIRKLEGRDITGARMPLNGPYLSPNQIAVLKRWIAIGAPNN
jgi:hypothetical protein